MHLVIPWWQQHAGLDLFGKAGLGVAGCRQQRLRIVAVAINHGNGSAERLAPGMHGQQRGTISGSRHGQLWVYRHPWQALGQAQVALQRFPGQRALGCKPLQQLVQIGACRADIADHAVIPNIAFDQHHIDLAISHLLRRQVGVRQQVAFLPIALGQARGVLLELAQGSLAPDQRLVVFAQVAQGEHRAAFEAHFMQHQPGIRRRPRGAVAILPGQLQVSTDRVVGVYRQVGAGQATFVLMAVEKTWQRLGMGRKRPRQQQQGHGQRTHSALHVPWGCKAAPNCLTDRHQGRQPVTPVTCKRRCCLGPRRTATR